MLDLRVITPPATEPIDVAAIKQHLHVDHAYDDAYLAALITAARQYIEQTTNVLLAQHTLEWRLDAWPLMLFMPRTPTRSITSVVVVDDQGAQTTIPASAYTLRTGTHPERLLFEPGAAPTVTLAETEGVRVQFVAGYQAADIPQPLVHALRVLVATWYATREAVGDGGQRELPFTVSALLSSYALDWCADWVVW